jgi:hypothetical protein
MAALHPDPAFPSLDSSGERLITLWGQRTVRLGVSLHGTRVIDPATMRERLVVRLWAKGDDDAWRELANEADAAVVARASDTSATPVTFTMRTRPRQGVAIKQIRVQDPSTSEDWAHANDGLSAQTELVLAAGRDAFIQAPFKVQALDEHGQWWGQDPYIRVERVMYGDGAI